MLLRVTFGRKTTKNPFYGKGSPLCFFINKVEAPVLTLRKGKEYTFDINTRGHPFYISRSEIGAGAEPIIDGIEQIPAQGVEQRTDLGIERGQLKFTPLVDYPKLYYQCGLHEYMGNRIIDPPGSLNQKNSSNSNNSSWGWIILIIAIILIIWYIARRNK